jgi:hypothetical protein
MWSVICGRGGVDHIQCRLAVELPSGGEEDVRVIGMESEVGSRNLSYRPPDHGMLVGAHQLWLCG